MSSRTVGIVMQPTEAHEAKGVLIRRTIGSEKLILLDPFLLLDHLTLANDGTGADEIGFPRHPHRGIETLTYVFTGRVKHKDSLGNEEIVSEYETQYMTAGAGIFHEEMVFAEPERGHESLQLWINLPANGKMVPAAYRAAHKDEVPMVTTPEGATVRVVAGKFGEATGPLVGIAAHPTYLDVTLPAGGEVTLPAPGDETAFAYLITGNALFGEERTDVSAAHLAIFTEASGDSVAVTAGSEGARLIFVTGRPWHEPVLQYRSLVMTTVAQMKEALDDIERGTFARPQTA